MRLSELLEKTPDLLLIGDGKDREITDVTDDSRKAGAEGTLFVAHRGHRSDGATFALDAYRRGARVFLSERKIDLPIDCTLIICKSEIKTSAELLFRLYGNPQEKLAFVGITGTKGKTTTAFFLTQLLRRAKESVASVGTLGIDSGNGIVPTENTTPSLFFLVPHLADFVRRGIRTVVMEVSSQALADGRVYGIPFSLGIFTSFSPDHIGREEHRDLAEYVAAKRSLFTSYGIRTAIANADAQNAAYMIADVPEKLFCSTEHPADFYGRILAADRDGTRFTLFGAVGKISMPGRYHVDDALLALAAASVLTKRSAESFLPMLSDVTVPGRFERVWHNGRLFFIDFAHNAESVRKFSSAVRELYPGRQIAVFGSVGGRGEARRALLAEAAEGNADFCVITSDDPGTEDPLGICAEIYARFRDKTKAKIVVDREQAIRYAYLISSPGDVILLLGKGHEEVQKTAAGALPFSEKNILSALDNPSRVC